MSHAAHGRHRASTPDERRFPWAIAATALVTAGVLGIGAVALLWPDRASSPEAADPTASPASPSPSAQGPTATVESSRDVSVDGMTVTVEEVSDLVAGDDTTARPTTATPLGLQLIGSALVTPDGRTTAFDAPIALTASGSLTVRNRYRLTDCPDVLPALWPSPVEFPDATRTYLRLDGPLHTAYALCPKSASRARTLPQLFGVLVEGDGVLVRLSWRGTGDLTIRDVGSASGVAALATDSRCDDSCIAVLAAGSSEIVQFQPVDPCPPATTSSRLTLVVGGGDVEDVVALSVQGLAKAVCR
ncbi:MAG: hypothetical protein ABI720_09050 [Actinomycetes bacterium]